MLAAHHILQDVLVKLVKTAVWRYSANVTTQLLYSILSRLSRSAQEHAQSGVQLLLRAGMEPLRQ